MSCLFNSYDPYFKQPFGALRAGQTVRLTLCIPEELGYVDPHLVLQKEGKYDVPVHYRMKFDGQTPQQNHFSVELPLNDPGLYFYYFDLYTDFRRIYRGPDNCGVVSWQEGEKWQITVYDAGFQTPECIKGKVFYQIFPDRFCEGIENKPMPFPDRLYQADKHAEPFWQPNETGGHLNEDYFGGDLEGIRIKLPYLREMGVDYLYLNPIFEAHSNHRYNTADNLNVDPLLGTNEEIEVLCREAAKYGIGIVLDGVFSHTGSDSRYFNREGRYGDGGAYRDPNSPYRSWYDFDPKYKGGYRSWWGFETLPEVNEENPSYVEFITGEGGVIDTWLRRGAAGFRLDVADELPDDFIEKIRAAVKRVSPEKFLLGEVWEDATTKYGFGQRRTYLLGKGLDSVMNYPFKNAVLDFVKGKPAEQAMGEILSICEHYPAPAMDTALNFLSTHDTERALTVIADEPANGRGREWQSGRCVTGEGGVIDTWLRRGAAGFRLDVADELPDDFIEKIRAAVKRVSPEKFLLGEVWEDATTKYGFGQRRTYLLGKGLDSVMNYPFKNAVLDFVKGKPAEQAMGEILSICEHYPAPAMDTALNFLSTHDTERALTVIADEPANGRGREWQSGRCVTGEAYEEGMLRLRMAYAIIYTLPGVPCLYYGDEIGMQGYRDPFNRAFFCWDSHEKRLKPVLAQLAQLRHTCEAFRTGELRVLRAQDGILHYQRVGEAETAEIIVNRSEHIIVEPLASGKHTEVNPMGFTIVVEENGHNPNHSYYDIK